jgi:hypothetical protein
MFVTDVILCEDIRLEEGGKTSLMGVFADKININLAPDYVKPADFKFPIRLGACFKVFVEETLKERPNTIGFQLNWGEEKKIDIHLPFEIRPPNRIVIIRILPQVVVITESCKLSVTVTLLQGEKELYRYDSPYNVDVLVHEP